MFGSDKVETALVDKLPNEAEVEVRAVSLSETSAEVAWSLTAQVAAGVVGMGASSIAAACGILLMLEDSSATLKKPPAARVMPFMFFSFLEFLGMSKLACSPSGIW